jgi:hypothetical protein
MKDEKMKNAREYFWTYVVTLDKNKKSATGSFEPIPGQTYIFETFCFGYRYEKWYDRFIDFFRSAFKIKRFIGDVQLERIEASGKIDFNLPFWITHNDFEIQSVVPFYLKSYDKIKIVITNLTKRPITIRFSLRGYVEDKEII